MPGAAEGGRGSPGSGGETPQEPSPSMQKCSEQPKTMGTFWGNLVKLTLVPAIPTAPSKIQTELGTPRWAQSPGFRLQFSHRRPCWKSPGVLTLCAGALLCPPVWESQLVFHVPTNPLGMLWHLWPLFLPALGQRMFPIGG